MHIQCTICSDLVNQAESLYVTKCGHIFHHQCLAQWIERSKSCPQCRNKVTERCMFRVFPTVSEGSREDAATLQARLDHAALQLRTHQAQLKDLHEQLAQATANSTHKDALVAAAEKRLVAQECALAALRQKLAHAADRTRDTERLQRDNEQLHRTLHTLNGLQRVLQATAGEVEDTLRDYSDPRTVATFAAALKR
ncbi:hypothetical protein MSG28_008372 [Choristoneura fumiferana]|uniref:Uncharacterized protein n=2 Tax=Choristoneura fumiferana TaxID=7141 RepID=A0ACC0J4T4_CHOFU|nr:hypothetical protein MSG28_008372 [Choristoneura fumiferana]